MLIMLTCTSKIYGRCEVSKKIDFQVVWKQYERDSYRICHYFQLIVFIFPVIDGKSVDKNRIEIVLLITLIKTKIIFISTVYIF